LEAHPLSWELTSRGGKSCGLISLAEAHINVV
jgi:hypothetical protein